MKTSKIQQVGDKLILKLPDNLGIKDNQEFVSQVSSQGVISLIPVPSNPFEGDEDLSMTDDFDGLKLLDDEIQ
ncbi:MULTISPECIES: type II toxin-antitoxin system PemI/MazE family antitoxin [Streptococcus]|uniref:type II toxin-antitoxin system PemI/MazE family antitoxin n=1 Tax=Streptococcus TaxID=1301 RepID=UPI0001E994D6|nr:MULTISPECIES: hypothetical protein [Streptococcus]EFQ57598.1 hypothetical protein HMPREF9176_1733 [Streptococcus downei F0415]